ncbi:5,10-methylenetetrahydrofolate reductase [Arthrobacter sp. RIT-PI-e]|uniref:methylenetetrahydrofolate reductase n=1 Tax=Arthrobacter sp. RIT-PI-e TaxID=1681197 RepID=UPI0006761DE6|nr:methylenetetrahydrofolate reductase [Arthrobacter sp. RIT-PI-e]KNC20510.1 5,10-methylenetetrahydrofolate reductase [Arthrobacter sp. RIT-PI-e]
MSPSAYPALSFELYPPRNSEAQESLWTTVQRLEETRPDFVSVTYGAAGSNREAAIGLLRHLLTDTTLKPLAHLTCVGSTRVELVEIVERLLDGGVRGLLALRGDLPEGRTEPSGEIRYADEFVRLIREVESGRTAQLAAGKVSVGVAAYAMRHPESESLEQDVAVLLAKEAAGADFAITQIFFRRSDYAGLLTRARDAGVTIPIIPGLIPFTSPRRLTKLCDLAGIEPDRDLMARLEEAEDDDARRSLGVGATVELGRAVLDEGAPGIHLYTFNQPTAALDVLEALDLARPPEAGSAVTL